MASAAQQPNDVIVITQTEQANDPDNPISVSPVSWRTFNPSIQVPNSNMTVSVTYQANNRIKVTSKNNKFTMKVYPWVLDCPSNQTHTFTNDNPALYPAEPLVLPTRYNSVSSAVENIGGVDVTGGAVNYIPYYLSDIIQRGVSNFEFLIGIPWYHNIQTPSINAAAPPLATFTHYGGAYTTPTVITNYLTDQYFWAIPRVWNNAGMGHFTVTLTSSTVVTNPMTDITEKTDRMSVRYGGSSGMCWDFLPVLFDAGYPSLTQSATNMNFVTCANMFMEQTAAWNGGTVFPVGSGNVPTSQNMNLTSAVDIFIAGNVLQKAATPAYQAITEIDSPANYPNGVVYQITNNLSWYGLPWDCNNGMKNIVRATNPQLNFANLDFNNALRNNDNFCQSKIGRAHV